MINTVMCMALLLLFLSISITNRPQEDPFEDIPLFDLEAPVTI